MYAVEALSTPARYQDHDSETFDSTMDITQVLAVKYYLSWTRFKTYRFPKINDKKPTILALINIQIGCYFIVDSSQNHALSRSHSEC
jgi:hypothetical protein